MQTQTVTEEEVVSDEMKSILEYQQQIKTWLHDVKRKIYETETIYLEETQLGNIVKGWEIDGRPPLARVRGQCDEKERLFSYSSYETYADLKSTQDNSLIEKKLSITAAQKAQLGPKGRKNKKRKSDAVDDWNNVADY
jgi:chromatin modification-related protein EAF6